MVTTPNTRMTEMEAPVTQEAREAANAWLEEQGYDPRTMNSGDILMVQDAWVAARAEGFKSGVEEAARVAEGAVPYVVGQARMLCDDIATAIRALTHTEEPNSG